MDDKDLYRDIAENKAQIQAIKEDVKEVRDAVHEIREGLIKPILAWQNKAIGIGIAAIAMGNIINDWLRELKAYVFK